VRQTRIQWIRSDKRFVWEKPDWERWPTLKKSQEYYEARLQTLGAKGFKQADMDPF
jgi:hypothetical protein